MARRFLTCFGYRATTNTTTHPDTIQSSSSDDHSLTGPVLVELFSSQGCATSPEADLVVSRLGRGDFNLDFPVIVLGFHVDYWDHNGWKDPFGSSMWTVRQKAYVEALELDMLFTPQVVVQGRKHCVGNEEEKLLAAVLDAPRCPSPSFQATFQRSSKDTLQVSLTGALRSKIDHQGVNIMVTLFESGLLTDCPAGENKGRVLSNDFVVRRLEKMRFVKDISAKKMVSGTLSFPLWEGFNPAKCGIAVFVQNSSHQIFGSQRFDLPANL